MDRIITCSIYFAVATLCLPANGKTIYVDADATGANDGTAWTNAFASLPTAISSAFPGDEVWVAEGTYAAISLINGVSIYGGFAGTETTASASNPKIRQTYISGGTHVVTSIGNDASAVLRGFYITGGFAGELPEGGGGLYLKNSSPVVVNCVFTNNASTIVGGAVANYGAGNPTFVNCQFRTNQGGFGGGAVYNYTGSPTFTNCLFYGNEALEGGGIVNIFGSPAITNCTLTENQATGGKGGALFDSGGNATVRNAILWNNQAVGTGDEIYNSSGGTTVVTYSDVEGGFAGVGNISSNPQFVDASSNNYRVSSTSPCLNAGLNASLPSDVADLDWDGNTSETISKDLAVRSRISESSVEIGAYEVQAPPNPGPGPGGGGKKRES